MTIMKRDLKIDSLRAIGILCIILAHVGCPGLLFQLRNFDVVLMVFLIGTMYARNQSNRSTHSAYIRKRFKRLIVPTWEFLVIYFLICFFIRIPLSFDTILHSFAMSTGSLGIGYVWIMRIFFIVGIISPYLYKIVCLNKNRGILALMLMYVIYELLIVVGGLLTDCNFIYYMYNEYIVYGLAYSIICGLGMIWEKCNNKNKLFYAVLSFILFIVLLFANDFAPTQIAKHPPKLYYILYGFIVTIILYEFAYQKCFHKITHYLFENNALAWLGKNSMWLYLWHILPIKLIEEELILNDSNFIVKFGVVLLVSIGLTMATNKIRCVKNKIVRTRSA